MVELHAEDTISVFVEHLEQDKLTRASLEWQEPPVHDTYTIAAHNRISVSFDSHFPVRPSGVDWHIHKNQGRRSLDKLFGEEFTEVMVSARELGFCSLELALGKQHRKELAKVQLGSPSTPIPIQQLCRQIIDAPHQTRGDGVAA